MLQHEPVFVAPRRPDRRARPASGSCSGALHARLRPSMPQSRTTASQKRLPTTYWRSLRSRPSRRSSSLTSGGFSRRRRSSASRSLGSDGQHRRARGVHDVLGVALDEGHRRLQAVDDLLALGPGDRVHEAALAHRVPRRAQVLAAWAGAAARPARSRPRPRTAARAASPARCSRSHGDAGELHRVGDLVEDDPVEQLGLVGRRRCAQPRAGWAPRAAAAAGARGRAAPARTGRARAAHEARRSRRPRRR